MLCCSYDEGNSKGTILSGGSIFIKDDQDSIIINGEHYKWLPISEHNKGLLFKLNITTNIITKPSTRNAKFLNNQNNKKLYMNYKRRGYDLYFMTDNNFGREVPKRCMIDPNLYDVVFFKEFDQDYCLMKKLSWWERVRKFLR